MIRDPPGVVELIEAASIVVDPTRTITVVGDAADNRILEVAVEGAVDVIVSGDKDLLELRAFEGIPILTAAAFLALLAGG